MLRQKYITAALIILFFSIPAHADWTFLFEGGLNIGFPTGDTAVTGSSASNQGKGRPRLGLIVGGLVETPISRRVSFQLGVEYLQSGGSAEVEIVVFNTQASLALDYLQLPLTFVWHPSRRRGLYLKGGVAPGYIVKRKGSFAGVPVSQTNAYRSFDLSGLVELGFDYRIGSSAVGLLGVRFTRGFLNIAKQTGVTFHNQAASVIFGLGF